jgi:Ala-tRNA(Pro) deacylase
MPSTRIKKYLDDHGIKYVAVTHSTAYTAQEAAAYAHIPGKELAKTVIVKLDGAMAMAVLPASYHIEMDQLADVAGVGHADLATEEEFADAFPDCDTGAMPPFGNLYGMDVYVAESLSEDEQIAFAAGSHRELIRMDYRDFARLVQPKVLKFSELTIPT